MFTILKTFATAFSLEIKGGPHSGKFDRMSKPLRGQSTENRFVGNRQRTALWKIVRACCVSPGKTIYRISQILWVFQNPIQKPPKKL